GFHTKVVVAGRYFEVAIRQLQHEHTLLWRLLCENDSYACLIDSPMPVGGVVHLENEVRASRDKFGYSRRPTIRQAARCINDKHVAFGSVGVPAILFIGQTRRRKWQSDRRIP